MFVEVGLKLHSDFQDARSFCYIYSGYDYNYNQVEGQEYDWNTSYSSWNGNSTDSDWGFLPFILYKPL